MQRNVLRMLCLGLVTGGVMLRGNSSDLFLLNSCLLAAISALALNLLMGTAGQPSLGTTAFLAVGGFLTVAFMHQNIPFVIALVLAAAVAGLGGLILGLPSLRIRGVYLALATLGAFFLVTYFAQQYQDDEVGPAGFALQPLFGSAPDLVQQRYWSALLFGAVLVTAVAIDQLTSGRAGRALRMIRDHEAAAPALGIPVVRYKLIAFVLYASLTAVAGSLGAAFTGNVSTDAYSLAAAISYIVMILIGGIDSVTGAVIGAFVITLLPVFVSQETTAIAGSTFAATYGTSISEGIYGLAILVLLTSGRGGLAGLGAMLWTRFRDRSGGQMRGKSGEDLNTRTMDP